MRPAQGLPQALTWPGRATAKVAAGAEVLAALRAEQIRLGRTPGELGALDTHTAAVVLDAIFEGDRTVYLLRLSELAGLELRAFDHAPGHDRTIAAGARVTIGWNAEDLAVFPA